MKNQADKLKILRIPKTNTLVLLQEVHNTVFIGTSDSIIISLDTYIGILNKLLKLGYVSPKVLQGLLEEFHTA